MVRGDEQGVAKGCWARGDGQWVMVMVRGDGPGLMVWSGGQGVCKG